MATTDVRTLNAFSPWLLVAISGVCSLINLLQDNDDLPALHLVPKSRVANGTALTAVMCKMRLHRVVQKYEFSSALPHATGSEGTEEVRICNWGAEEGCPDLYSSYF